MSLIKVENLNFEYPKKKILKNISFEIAQGSINHSIFHTYGRTKLSERIDNRQYL